MLTESSRDQPSILKRHRRWRALSVRVVARFETVSNEIPRSRTNDNRLMHGVNGPGSCRPCHATGIGMRQVTTHTGGCPKRYPIGRPRRRCAPRLR